MRTEKRNLILYLFGTNTSVFGDVLLTTALALYVMEMTKSPQAFGAILAMAFVPRLLLNIFSGAIVDKLNSRYVMIGLDFLRSGVLFVVSSMNDINMSVLIPMVLFFAAADTFFIPASISVVPRLFKKNEISLVNSMDQSLRSVFNVVSPLIASAIMLTLGIQVVFIIDALTFAFSGLAECFLVFNESEKVRKNGNILEDILDGVKTILSDVRIRSLMINGALTHLFLFTFIEIGMISLLIVTFKSPEYHYGILQSVISVSAIIASAIAISYRKKGVLLYTSIMESLE